MAQADPSMREQDSRVSLRARLSRRGLLVFAVLLMPLLCPAQRWHATAMRHPRLLKPPPLSDMAHVSWTRRDGAPSDIAALAQTADGYLWIGSRLGLFRFDGLQFLHYPFGPSDPQLPSSDISALAADPKGGLWIGYRLGGISYLNGAHKIDYGRASGLINESTEQLVCRGDGSVWATADGRLMHLEGGRWENYAARHGLNSEGLYTLFFDRDGTLWTAEKGRIFRLHAGESAFETLPVPTKGANEIVQTPDGAIWISDAFDAVRPLDPAARVQAVPVPGAPVLLADGDGSIWVAHDSNGLSRIRPLRHGRSIVENYATQDGLTDSQTRALLKDRQGTVWVGTARGLDRFRPSPLKPFTEVALDYYPAILADPKGGVWLNDMDKPLMLLRSGRLTFRGGPHGSSSLFQDASGTVWLFDQITRDFFAYPVDGSPPRRIVAPEEGRQVENWCLGQDLDGAMLACFEGHGLWRFDQTWSRVSAPELPAEAPFSMAAGVPGHLWLGFSYDRIVLRDAAGFHLFGPERGLALNTALTFYEDGEVMLVGGSDGLAVRQGDAFHPLALRTTGLLHGISGIVRDRWGDLWLNAAAGVIRLPSSEWHAALKDPKYSMDFQLLQERDGLIGTPAQSKPAPSAVVDRDGLLWFATSSHLVALDPATMRQQRDAPSVLLQSVLVNGRAADASGAALETRTSGALKTLEINYIGLDLHAPDRVHYQYLLEGQDREWQDAGTRRQVFYTNLPPGPYRFRLRAASGTGEWSELETLVAFDVRPAFYQTNWFYLLTAAVASVLLWWLYSLRVRFVTAKVRERFEERMVERVRIARDLHDTLLQGVQGLVLRFHFAAEQLPPEEPMRDALRLALSQADQVIREGRDKIGSLRTVGSDGGSLEKSLGQVATSLAADAGLQIVVAVKGTPKPLHAAVEDELYFIGREALTNAARHAEATHIALELTFETRYLSVLCRDNGKGLGSDVRDGAGKKDHWGITGMRERAQRVGSKLRITSAPQTGTQVEVRVAGKRAYRGATQIKAAMHSGSSTDPTSRAAVL